VKKTGLASLLAISLLGCAPNYPKQMEQAERATVAQQTSDLGTPTQVRQGSQTMAQVLYSMRLNVYVPAQVKPEDEAHRAQLVQETQDLETALTAIARSGDDASFVYALEAMCSTDRINEQNRVSDSLTSLGQFAVTSGKIAPGTPAAQANQLVMATGQILASIPARCANLEQAIAAEQLRERDEQIAVAQRNAELAQVAALAVGTVLGASMGGVTGALAGAASVAGGPGPQTQMQQTQRLQIEVDQQQRPFNYLQCQNNGADGQLCYPY
jgi:outer membrane lipoprotein SlyB